MYIGDKEVKSVKDLVVTFKDGSTKEYTKRQLEYVQTEEPKDLTQFRDMELEQMVLDVFEVYKAHNIKKGMITPLQQYIAQTYDKQFYDAVGKAFGTHVEGAYFADQMEEISIIDIERVSKGK